MAMTCGLQESQVACGNMHQDVTQGKWDVVSYQGGCRWSLRTISCVSYVPIGDRSSFIIIQLDGKSNPVDTDW